MYFRAVLWLNDGDFSFFCRLRRRIEKLLHHRTIRQVSTTFTHPDSRWGNHLSAAHPVGVNTFINYCTGSLIRALLIKSNMFM